MFTQFFSKIKKDQEDSPDSQGDTSLHIAIRSGLSEQELKQFISKIGPYQAGKMARIINNSGLLPIDLISTVSPEEKLGLRTLLLPLMTNFPFKNLKEPLDEKQIVTKYTRIFNPSSRLQKNLKFACEAANKAREVIKESETHPQTNRYPADKKNILRINTRELADKKKELVKRISPDYYIHQSNNTRIQIIKCISDLYTKAGIGSCDALSYIAMNYLIEKGYDGTMQIIYIENGDHIFLMLDGNLENKTGIPINLGENSVVCDPWSGKVYPASEITKELNNFEHYSTLDSYINTLTTVNFKYHTLQPCFELSLSEKPLLTLTKSD